MGMMFLKTGPQDLPFRKDAYLTICVGYVVVGTACLMMIGNNLMLSLLQVCISGLFVAAFCSIVLRIGKKRERFIQTFMALLATGILFDVFAVGPLSVLFPFLQEISQMMVQGADPMTLDAEQVPKVPAMPLMAVMFLMLWQLMVMGHIFRHALDASMSAGVAVASAYPAILLLLTMLGR